MRTAARPRGRASKRPKEPFNGLMLREQELFACGGSCSRRSS